jgi:uncharacterized protein YcbK (DUF882 family)
VRLTKDFERCEFDCHDGALLPDDLLPNVHRLCMDVLQPIRDAWGHPLIVVSGWRTHAWNARVGGAAASKHLTAEAADIRPLSPRDVPLVLALINDMRLAGTLPKLSGLGVYPRWIHVDVGRTTVAGKLRRWTGLGIGSEPSA